MTDVIKPPSMKKAAFGEIGHVVDLRTPTHYLTGIQPIEFLKANFSPGHYEGFLLGNIFKYTSRYKHKDGIADLKKARHYLDMLIQFEEQATNATNDKYNTATHSMEGGKI